MEDIDLNREIVLSLLEGTQTVIEEAVNGEDALNRFLLAPQRYDLILMDVQMPVMDGYEATRAIRALDFEKAKTIPIIAMTANVFNEDVQRCLQAGMNAHIGKPVEYQQMLETLCQYL
ncbi:hypothetical protein FACS18947_7220 [Bacteroidia bacterium]|nr:hypothetical protein FACS18947_7220 [Bacteroidia bacterium]